MSSGVEETALFRQAAGYVDRILRGPPPGILPIQAPSAFQLVVNTRTARVLDLQILPLILAQADEVIQWVQETVKSGFDKAAQVTELQRRGDRACVSPGLPNLGDPTLRRGPTPLRRRPVPPEPP
jgi:hypothetical protein